MPQLDPTSFSSQLFWLTVSFVVLYVLLARYLLPRVQSVMEARAHTVEGDIAQAKHMKTEAEIARDAYEKALADARAQSQALLAQAQADIAARNAAGHAKLDREIEKKLSDADASIRRARQDVMGKLAPVSGELASLIVEVLMHHKPDAKQVGAVINEISRERQL